MDGGGGNARARQRGPRHAGGCDPQHQLEYRVVGQHLLLLDTAADLIVDYILNAITT